jgi:hypothetical protein
MALKSSIRPSDRKVAALEERYRSEDMSTEERCELRDRILKLRRSAESVEETVEAHFSCLERGI